MDCFVAASCNDENLSVIASAALRHRERSEAIHLAAKKEGHYKKKEGLLRRGAYHRPPKADPLARNDGMR